MYSFRDGDFLKCILVVMMIGVVLGWIIFNGLPLLWEVVKPWIHEVTR